MRTLAEHRHAEPSGMLRVSMLADFSTLLLAPMLTRFTERYPRIELRLDLSPRRVDLVAENFDLAIRMGRLADDATLVAGGWAISPRCWSPRRITWPATVHRGSRMICSGIPGCGCCAAMSRPASSCGAAMPTGRACCRAG